MKAIRFDHVSKRFPGAAGAAVDDCSLRVEAGEFVTLLGPSGCGKTTLLKMVNRLYEPTGGTIFIDDIDVRKLPVTELRRQIGYVIQQTGLFPHMTVAQNIAVVPTLLGWKKARIAARIDELLTLIELRPGEYRRALPGAALRRAAAAGRAGARARRRPRRDPDGRALQRDRRDHARDAARRADPPPARGPEDDPLRDARCRGGVAPRRPDRGDAGRADRAVRHALHHPDPARRRLRRRTPRRGRCRAPPRARCACGTAMAPLVAGLPIGRRLDDRGGRRSARGALRSCCAPARRRSWCGEDGAPVGTLALEQIRDAARNRVPA